MEYQTVFVVTDERDYECVSTLGVGSTVEDAIRIAQAEVHRLLRCWSEKNYVSERTIEQMLDEWEGSMYIVAYQLDAVRGQERKERVSLSAYKQFATN